jgi:hypothetical protein
MRRILSSLKVITLAAILVIGGTIVYFAHTEASAVGFSDEGKMDLELNEQDSKAQTFQLINVAPGDSGRGSNRLVNAGNLIGNLSINFCEVVNTTGTNGEYADGSGDLGAEAVVAIYVDVDVNGNWNSGDIGLKSDETTYSYPLVLNYDYINNYSDKSWNSIKTIDTSDNDDFVILWGIPVSAGNEIQGDGISFDITFTLE